MRIVRVSGVVAAGVLAATFLSPVPAADAAVPGPFVVDFTGETPGAVPNGYATAANPGVLFFDTSGADLRIYDNVETHGPGMLALSDDASALEIRLAGPTRSIRLAFGNDDPFVADVTDQAQLTLFRGAVQVGQVTKNVNANDLMDQTIGFTGKLFNRVQFQYVDAAQAPLALAEVVDDIRFTPLCTVTGSAASNRLTGTPGRDVICAEGGNDIVRGLGGADLIYSGPGNDRVSGGGGGDVIFGDNGADRIAGGPGADRIAGGRGADRLVGGGGPDALNGGLQRDTCNGGPARDRGPGCEVKIFIP